MKTNEDQIVNDFERDLQKRKSRKRTGKYWTNEMWLRLLLLEPASDYYVNLSQIRRVFDHLKIDRSHLTNFYGEYDRNLGANFLWSYAFSGDGKTSATSVKLALFKVRKEDGLGGRKYAYVKKADRIKL